MQQGGQGSGHARAMPQASLSTGWEDGNEGKQTNSGSSLSPNLWFAGFHLQGENTQCNSKLP